MSRPCPQCEAQCKCVNSRHRPDGTVQRRFLCTACGCRLSSVEVVVSVNGRPTVPVLNDNPKSNSKRLQEVIRQVKADADPVELMQSLLNEITRVRP